MLSTLPKSCILVPNLIRMFMVISEHYLILTDDVCSIDLGKLIAKLNLTFVTDQQ